MIPYAGYGIVTDRNSPIAYQNNPRRGRSSTLRGFVIICSGYVPHVTALEDDRTSAFISSDRNTGERDRLLPMPEV